MPACVIARDNVLREPLRRTGSYSQSAGSSQRARWAGTEVTEGFAAPASSIGRISQNRMDAKGDMASLADQKRTFCTVSLCPL